MFHFALQACHRVYSDSILLHHACTKKERCRFLGRKAKLDTRAPPDSLEQNFFTFLQQRRQNAVEGLSVRGWASGSPLTDQHRRLPVLPRLSQRRLARGPQQPHAASAATTLRERNSTQNLCTFWKPNR